MLVDVAIRWHAIAQRSIKHQCLTNLVDTMSDTMRHSPCRAEKNINICYTTHLVEPCSCGIQASNRDNEQQTVQGLQISWKFKPTETHFASQRLSSTYTMMLSDNNRATVKLPRYDRSIERLMNI